MAAYGQSAAAALKANYARTNMPDPTSANIQFANYLRKHLALAENVLHIAERNAAAQQRTLLRWLAQEKILSGNILMHHCAAAFSLPTYDLTHHPPPTDIHLSVDFMQRHQLIPLHKSDGHVHVGCVDPTDQACLDAIVFNTGYSVVPYVIAYDQCTLYLQTHFTAQHTTTSRLLEHIHRSDETQSSQNQTDEDNAAILATPLVQLVDHIILQAQTIGASDIHIEPAEHHCRIRYRRLGVLETLQEIPNRLARRMITRLKVMAKLDIAEQRLPQDGRFPFKNIDIRISSCPLFTGEKIVLRLLDTSRTPPELNRIGLDAHQQTLLQTALQQPQGMILVTGPTGSGKTTTLYAALNYLNQPEKNITTLEDPVEIRLNGINQININHRIGLGFAAVLRALLRQDPDIIMIGEIRDAETAEIAMHAAQTGHLVLATLHTPHAIATLTRLHAMGIATHYITNNVKLIIAQRLVRTLCPHCKTQGCSQCVNGFAARTALYEILPLTEKFISSLTATQTFPSQQHLQKTAETEGFVCLQQAGQKKVAEGVTTADELTRILGVNT